MLRGRKQPVTKLLSSCSVVCPHSTTVEKYVSTKGGGMLSQNVSNWPQVLIGISKI